MWGIYKQVVKNIISDDSNTVNNGKDRKKYCAGAIMYCDFCGNKLSYNIKYCRKCGRQLKDSSGDTQPIPVIDETMLSSAKPQTIGSAPWYKWMFNTKTPARGSKVGRVLYYLASVAIIGGLVYVLTIFKTVKEYQILTATIGCFWAIYFWRKG